MSFFVRAFRCFVGSVMLLSLLAFHADSVFGKAPSDTANVTVFVFDRCGPVVSNADVTFKGENTVTAKTEQDGSGHVSLPYGSYVVTITEPGSMHATAVLFSVATAQPPVLKVALCGHDCQDCFGLDTWKFPTVIYTLPNVIVPRALLLPLNGLPPACPKSQPKTEAALIELEHHWADALTHRDSDVVACILADEFEDADVDGSLHTRAEALAHIPQRKPWANRLTEMRAHVDGDSAFVRGLNEVVDQDGKVVARVRFTDIFAYRDGRWQALAGQETLVGEAHR